MLFHSAVEGDEWNIICEQILSLYLWGRFWEVVFFPPRLTDNTGRSSWSAALARRPLHSARHLSKDLIIHEHLKSFQFIKHLSSKSHVGSMRNLVLHCSIKVSRVAHLFFFSACLFVCFLPRGIFKQSWQDSKHSVDLVTCAICLGRIH